MACFAHGEVVIGKKIIAKNGSIAVEGDVDGDIYNVSLGDHSTLHLSVGHALQVLPSYLAEMIVAISEERISEYGEGHRRGLPPEVRIKLEYNNFDISCRLLRDYTTYSHILEKAYSGAQLRNPDVRRLVRRRSGVIYSDILDRECESNGVQHDAKDAYAASNSHALVQSVVRTLILEYAKNCTAHVKEETVHLAVSLIVADAIVECEVLQRP